MSRKKNKKFQETTIENYYDLRIDKVDELVSALKDEDPVFEEDISYGVADNTGVYDSGSYKRSGKQKQFDPYKTDFLGKIPAWIKALFVKFWFAGAVCYFVMWGIRLGDSLDSLVLTGAVLGLIVDMFVNPIFRYIETDRKEYNAFMMFPFPFKAYWTFFANMIYYVLVLMGVNGVYIVINYIANVAANTQGFIHVGVEPLLFGALCVAVDMVAIGIKDGIVAIVRHNKNKKKENEANV